MSDPRDILTLAEGKRVLRVHVGDSNEDDELAIYITASARILDEHAGHTVAMTTTSDLYDGTNKSGRGYRSKIILRHRPILTVTSVIEHDGAEGGLGAPTGAEGHEPLANADRVVERADELLLRLEFQVGDEC